MRKKLEQIVCDCKAAGDCRSFGVARAPGHDGLYGECVLALLDPTARTLGPVYLSKLEGAVMGAPLPHWDSIMVAWPQIVGMVAASILLFVGGYVAFQRQEVRA